MNNPLMKCGHTANGIDKDGKPVCVICFGIRPGAIEIDETPPDLTNRRARCTYYGSVPSGRNHESNYGCKRGECCLCERPSIEKLPFFEHCPDQEFDRFYCGCWGWD